MPTPDIQHAVPLQEPRIEDRESARALTLKEKLAFQQLLMDAYASTAEALNIPVEEVDAALNPRDQIFSRWIRQYAGRFSELVAKNSSIRKHILETLASHKIEGVHFVQRLLDANLPQA